MHRIGLICFAVLAGCGFLTTEATCRSNITEKKTLLGDTERQTTCDCQCPKQSGGVIDWLITFFGAFKIYDTN